MKHAPTSFPAPGRLTVMAALMAGLCAPAIAASPDLVISQVYGGGGNSGATYQNDFVEIFNRGASAVSLEGKSIQYTSSAGTSWGSNMTVLPNVMLEPGQFYLVKLASQAAVGAALPTADHTPVPTINMSGSGGKVLLSSGTTGLTGVNPTTGVIDILGWGSAATGFEGAPAAGTSNTTASRRINACIDTDANNLDFSSATPTPRNTASPLTPCGGSPAIVLSCPASLTVQQGVFGSALLTGKDADDLVNGASITAGATTGISLVNFVASPGENQDASVSLEVAATVAAGIYPLTINFSNDNSQQKSCNVTVNVQGLYAVTRTIPQIQGNGAASPVAGTVQTTEGVVTMVLPTGFFLQDANGDGDPSTSDGIFVFMSTTAHGLVAGDIARVTGTVTEFAPGGAPSTYTEIKDTSQIIKMGSGASVAPTNVDDLAQLERVEGMLVNIITPLTVNGSEELGTRGELTLAVGRRETPTNRYPAGSPEALALAAANAVNKITLDDKSFTQRSDVPYLGQDGTVRVGDTVTGLAGVIDYAGAGYKLQPSETPQFSRTNVRLAAPEVAPGNVRVASANVLNYFTTLTTGFDIVGNVMSTGCYTGSGTTKGNCRGADTLAEYERQRDKIVAELKAIDADVVGLMEIQNNGDVAANALVSALNTEIGFAAYAVVPAPPSTGTDAIRVAMIYKPAKLALAGPSMSDADSVNNRPPMAQTFKYSNGGKFSVIVNHLKSKASCGSAGVGNTDTNGQGCWNLARLNQANRLKTYFIPEVQGVSGDADVLVIGDMNSHGFEDPINALTATTESQPGLVNQLERFVRPNGIVYSYVFDGASGYLDHALATPSLSAQVAGAVEWHNNADEPTVLDYNLDDEPKASDLYVKNAFRASDHDPVVISLNLAPTFVDATASFAVTRYAAVFNRATGKYSAKVTFKNTGEQAISGPFHVSFSGLAAGITVDNASGSKDGAPYITAADAGLAPGATATVNVTFSNPARAAISYGNTIYSGTF
jgi:uncharacterized protein